MVMKLKSYVLCNDFLKFNGFFEKKWKGAQYFGSCFFGSIHREKKSQTTERIEIILL
jgi:hypothetical protein